MQRSNPVVDKFYHSKEWKQCKKAYKGSINGLCERCLENGIKKAVYFIHHKEYITIENIYDTNITLNWDNLEGLCFKCHQKEHFKEEICYKFDENGELIPPYEA